MMEVKPVKHYAIPRYPKRDYLLEHPELLRLVPKRWQGNGRILATLGMVAFLMSACDALGGKVAPIFVHGGGRGGFGCVAVNPPVVLAEDEARQIIRDEAAKAGVNFSDTTETLSGVPPIKADGYDSKCHIAFEYVSLQDQRAWEDDKWKSVYGNVPRVISTAWSADVKQTADSIRASLSRSPRNPVTGVFYDPFVGGMEEWRALSEEKRKEYRERSNSGDYTQPHTLSEEQLRLQVRDFIQWLKSEGII